MAKPVETKEALPQLHVDRLEETGFVVPPGRYGLIEAAGVGIVRMSLVEEVAGMEALRKLGEPDEDSRSQEFEGRRLVRVNGGYLALNYMVYREKDHTAADRMRRYRARKTAAKEMRERRKREREKQEGVDAAQQVLIHAGRTKRGWRDGAGAEADA